MGQLQPPEVLSAIEEALAHHPIFGESAYIHEQLRVSLERRLTVIADRLPAAARLLCAMKQAGGASLQHLFGDTVVRCAILNAHTQLEMDQPFGLPLTECEAVFKGVTRRIDQGHYATTLDDGSLRRLGPEPFLGWIWSDEHCSDIFGRAFRFLMRNKYGAIPRTPTDEEIAVLHQGSELLQILEPALAPSALSHAHIIACVPDAAGWKGIASSSQFHLGGTIFLGRSLPGPWWVAEHLLHESLHQKLYDFRQGHSVQDLDMELQTARDDTPTVCSPWNPRRLNRSNQWDVNRVYAALHVYVHLAHLSMVAEQRATELEAAFGPLRGMTESTKACERAHYLAEKLREQCWDHVGPAGRHMADWMCSVLEFLNPLPPPKGAYIHLYLDHYRREAGQVVSALSQKGLGRASLTTKLGPLAKEEMAQAHAVLSSIGAREALGRLEKEAEQLCNGNPGSHFQELRHLIAKAILSVSPDGYRLTGSAKDDDLVRTMVENASDRVFMLQADYPPAVAAAKRRAHELRFVNSCDDNVGRLLGVLASALPPEGRILEIGTGAGTGTAWITAGLADRSDVELITVEVEERLSMAVQDWPWPKYVRPVNGDVLEALDAFDRFDLIFADAAPVKYHHMDRVLAMLKPGGLLVIDDLNVGARTDEAQRTEKNGLRSLLMGCPDVRVVEIDWASGVVLASRLRAIADENERCCPDDRDSREIRRHARSAASRTSVG